jgi:hypothetical protein
MLACIRDKMMFRLVLYCGFVFIVRLSGKILFAPFLFLPKFHSLGCDEIITTFHSGFSASAKVFFPAILPQSVCAGCNEIVTTFLIEKPTSQGMAKPCNGKWGSSN